MWGRTDTEVETPISTWCEELTPWKRPWCWERLKAGREGHDRGWDGWMASLTQWTWVWASSGSWWQTGKLGMLQSMGLQIVGHDWASELNWAEYNFVKNNSKNIFCDYNLWISKMNYSNVIQKERVELGILFYQVLELPRR